MRVRIEFQGPGFVAVPNHVAAMLAGDLSPDALAVLVFLALRPVGSEWNVDTIRTGLGWGRDRWSSASASLRAVGAVWDELNTGDDGRHRGRVRCIRWPDAPKAVARVRRPGKPKAGKPGLGRPGKPKAGKPGFRSSQAADIVVENGDELAQKAVPLKTKTGEAVAPPALAAASPGVNAEKPGKPDPAVIAAIMRDFMGRRCASGAVAEPSQGAENDLDQRSRGRESAQSFVERGGS